jgi:RNA-binding protein YhbY
MDGLWSRLVTAAEISTATPNLTQELAKRLTAQLIQHHGCCLDCHRQAQEEYEKNVNNTGIYISLSR